jgi:3'-phosphoadenosine 5'-phosphosulfate sulfotransferase (PAPS reductase)/FAD synthetase
VTYLLSHTRFHRSKANYQDAACWSCTLASRVEEEEEEEDEEEEEEEDSYPVDNRLGREEQDEEERMIIHIQSNTETTGKIQI